MGFDFYVLTLYLDVKVWTFDVITFQEIDFVSDCVFEIFLYFRVIMCVYVFEVFRKMQGEGD